MHFELRKIGHVVLNVTDLDASVRFYTDVLGLKVSDRLEHRSDRHRGPRASCGAVASGAHARRRDREPRGRSTCASGEHPGVAQPK